MDLHTFNVVISQLEQAIPHIKAAVNEAEAVSQSIKDLKAQKLEAETGYRQAYSDRAQIIEAIENLKKQHAQIEKDGIEKHAAVMAGFEKAVNEVRSASSDKIREWQSRAEKAEADSRSRVAAAVAAAVEAEKQLAAKRAAYEQFKAL